MKSLMQSLLRYRFFVFSSIRADFRARFVRSKLGMAWMVIHPLVQVLIFALVLSEVLSVKLPNTGSKYGYAIYLMAGILCWSLFSETVTRFLGVFIDNAPIIKKISFPRVCLAAIIAGSTLINNLLLLCAIVIVFAGLGHVLGPPVWTLPLLILLTLSLSTAVGLILGVANVFVRDIGQVVPVVLQVMFWLTPIVYSAEVLPPRLREALEFNPLLALVASYQDVLAFGVAPQWSRLTPLIAATVVSLFAALFVFRRASADMADVL